jgi:hypothetical protein
VHGGRRFVEPHRQCSHRQLKLFGTSTQQRHKSLVRTALERLLGVGRLRVLSAASWHVQQKRLCFSVPKMRTTWLNGSATRVWAWLR